MDIDNFTSEYYSVVLPHSLTTNIAFSLDAWAQARVNELGNKNW